MRTSSRTRLLGWVCVVCGALVAIAGFLLDSQAAGAVTADTATARFANGLFGVAVLGLMGGVLGLWSLRVGGSGWGCPGRLRWSPLWACSCGRSAACT
jgi:hypothetical protein